VSLSLQAIDRIFERLVAAYGRQFLDLYADVSPADVKTAWGHELADFSSPAGLKRIATVLGTLPERAPTAPKFRILCRQVHVPEAPPLPAPAVDPERLKRELVKLGEVRANVVIASTINHKAWAKRILARKEAGENVPVFSVLCATDALRRGAGVQ
jgi:hypothetical protein